jgi:hypothetical protein
LIDSLEEAAQTRNYLAHHFLRNYFLVAPSEKNKEQATKQLAEVSARLEDLQEALEAHLRFLGVPDLDELDEETMAEIDKLRPTEWLGKPAE